MLWSLDHNTDSEANNVSAARTQLDSEAYNVVVARQRIENAYNLMAKRTMFGPLGNALKQCVQLDSEAHNVVAARMQHCAIVRLSKFLLHTCFICLIMT